jgi:hypothetical protein
MPATVSIAEAERHIRAILVLKVGKRLTAESLGVFGKKNFSGHGGRARSVKGSAERSPA